MTSSDDEGERIHNVSDYEFIFGRDEPISFIELPIVWSKSGTFPFHSLDEKREIFLQGKTDNGLRKIYKHVIAWRFDTSYDKPEISVLSKDGNWIILLKPRHAFVIIIRSILISVHFLHFVKWNPNGSRKALWDHLTDFFSFLESPPSVDDLKDHMSLIRETAKRDEALAKSKLLLAIMEEKPVKKTFNEGVRSFIVDDDDNEEEVDASEDDESDEEDYCFDSVCAICDNGGDLHLCEGKCMRSFHATFADGEESQCSSLGFTDAEVEALKKVDFYCKNCEHKKHQCFVCEELGSSDESSGAEVFRCGNGACGHFYHPHCVAKLLHPDNEAVAKEQEEKIASGEQFACPVHRCFACKELEVRSQRELQFAICRRCPRAYHRKCLPRDIASEEDVQMGRNAIQRAWEGLIPNRILIYCTNHDIDRRLLTPARNHIKFPGVRQKVKKNLILESSQKKPLLKQRGSALEDIAGKSASKLPQRVANLNADSKLGDLSRKRLEKFPVHSSLKKQKVSLDRSSHTKVNVIATFDSDSSLGGKLFSTYFGTDSEQLKSTKVERADDEHALKTGRSVDHSLSLDAETKTRISSMMKEVSSSITLEQIKKMHKAPSTHAYSSKFTADNITLGKVEGSVQAIRGALKKMDTGGSIEDAKAVCGDDLLVLMMKWKDKLKVYLAPFLYGMRYTSFGRHFTKNDKLKEIVEMLHWYIQEGDMLVDFCCGSNDFSCFAKKKLDVMGKACLFKNYDIHQAKDDFHFEKRDWMGVKPSELPNGSRLIMGLNPPFGVNAALANKFIDKALEFKPKLLILIVPRETQRLDEKFPYDLIWEDDQMFTGKSFYLPGSLDVNDNQIEDWNVSAPILYLWSHRDWTSKHKDIALKNGHLNRRVKKNTSEETINNINVSDPKQECNNDRLLVNKYGDKDSIKPENQEPEAKGTPRHLDKSSDKKCADDNKNNSLEKNPSGAISRSVEDQRKRKRQSNNRFPPEDKKISKHPRPHDPSPNKPDGCSLDTYPSKHIDQLALVHTAQDRYRQPDQLSSQFSPFLPTPNNSNKVDHLARNSPFSQTVYLGNQDDDLARNYSLSAEQQYTISSIPSRQTFNSTSFTPDYGFRNATDQWAGHSSSIPDHNPRREFQSSWNQGNQYLSHPDTSSVSGIASIYERSSPAMNLAYGRMNTATLRYASRLDDLNHMQQMGSRLSAPPPRADANFNYPPPGGLRRGYQGFPPGTYNP